MESQVLSELMDGPTSIKQALDFLRNQDAQAELYVKRWSKMPTTTREGKVQFVDWLGQESVDRGFPELKSDHAKRAMAIILENQFRFSTGQPMAEAGGGSILQDQTTGTGGLALPTKFVLPIVRRAYALVIDRDFGVVQPLPGPTGYVFWLDFLRMNDSTNILSVEYNWAQIGELASPQKGTIQLTRAQVTVVKQLMGVTWSLEALEDARALLNIDIEQELLREFSNEFVRNIFARHLKEIWNQAATGTGTGAGLTGGNAIWAGPNTMHFLSNGGASAALDKRAAYFNGVVDADTDFKKTNRTPSDGILCGYGLAGLLEKLLTVTGTISPSTQNVSALGISDYGTFMGRWRIWGTDFLPDNAGVLYKRNPSMLLAGHFYCPYVPIQILPAIYADFTQSSGAYLNSDAYTRNIRERSAHIVVKPYAFQPINATTLTF